jgi:pyruvate dehydrogenase E2 component (dihydrolipoamide acetyltransferase)
MSEFRMPSLGADMVQGQIVEWRVKPGDHVQRGDVVVVVDTQKAAIEVEIFESGVIEELLVPEGARVPVGTVLARLRADGGAPVAGEAADAAAVEAETRPAPGAEAAPAAGVERASVEPERAAPAAAEPGIAPTSPARSAAGLPLERPSRPRASPAARALAAERGIDLSGLTGTGPEGAITRGDVEAAIAVEPRAGAPPPRRAAVTPVASRVAADLGVDVAGLMGTGPEGAITREDVERAAREGGAPSPAPSERAAPPEPEQLQTTAAPDRKLAMRQAIAAAVTRSKREIPHYYLSTRIDMSRALAWLDAENRERPMAERILPAALLLRATALALTDYPELNGFWVDDAFQPGEAIHLGVVVFLREGGLVAPAILAADRKSLGELMQALTDLVRRARSGGLRGSELTSATITVTNLGDRGVGSVFGVIYPPQVAIIGFGRITEEPWAENGLVGARPVLTATLAADHRASDGHRGALFLAAIDRLLHTPEAL